MDDYPSKNNPYPKSERLSLRMRFTSIVHTLMKKNENYFTNMLTKALSHTCHMILKPKDFSNLYNSYL